MIGKISLNINIFDELQKLNQNMPVDGINHQYRQSASNNYYDIEHSRVTISCYGELFTYGSYRAI